MSESTPTEQFQFEQDDRRYSKLAIASLVLGILFLCLGPLALVPLIMGIVGIMKTTGEGSKKGRGLAIAGVSLGAVGVMGTCLSAGVFIPALGKAQNRAQQVMSEIQIRSMIPELNEYADDHKNIFPAQSQWLDVVLESGEITQVDIDDTDKDDDGIVYIYVPGGSTFDSMQILIYEDPKHYDDAVVVGFADGHTEIVDHDIFKQMLAEQLGED